MPQNPRKRGPGPKGDSAPPWELLGWASSQQGLIRTVWAARGAKQLHSLMGRRCQKHVYLQTGHLPAKLQPRMVVKCSLAGGPRRWFLGQHWSPDWHHLSYGGQEPSRPPQADR